MARRIVKGLLAGTFTDRVTVLVEVESLAAVGAVRLSGSGSDPKAGHGRLQFQPLDSTAARARAERMQLASSGSSSSSGRVLLWTARRRGANGPQTRAAHAQPYLRHGRPLDPPLVSTAPCPMLPG